MVFFNPQLEVSVIAAALVVVSQAVQEMFGKRKELLKYQEDMKKKQAKMKELVKSTHPNAKKELEEAEKEMLESLNFITKNSMRMMVVSLIVFLPVYFLLGQIYGHLTFNLPIPIPWFAVSLEMFNPFTWFELYSQTNFVGWYALNALFFSLFIINPIMKFLQKKNEGVAIAKSK